MLAAFAVALAGHALIALLAARYGHQRPYFPPASAPGSPLYASLIAESALPAAAPPLPVPEPASVPDPQTRQAAQTTAAAPNTPSPTAEAAPPAAAAASFQERYYRTGEVDQPAAPVSEWRIDTARLPPGERYRAAMAVWVDARGRITRMEIARLSPDDDEARDALRDFSRTEMEPAVLGGERVANVRLIEVVFSRGGR